jgi:hypothetical protein
MVVGGVDNGGRFVDNFNFFISGDKEKGGDGICLDGFEVMFGPMDPFGTYGGRGFGD